MKYFYDTEFHEDGHTIDLISIGIVAEDGREYYAVNADANWFRIHSNEWLKANVVPQLPDITEWKPKEQIRDEVRAFLLRDSGPELWAWYSAYDHVVLAQLFGRMIDLPKGLPMFTHDLRAFITYQDNDQLPTQVEGRHSALADARWVKEAYEHVAAAAGPAPTVSEVEWHVALPAQQGISKSAEFETEEYARAAWLDNQPSALQRIHTDVWLTGEALAKWEARNDEAES